MNYKKIILVILSIMLIGLIWCNMDTYLDYGGPIKMLTRLFLFGL